MKYQTNKYKKYLFDKILLNFHLSVPIVHKDLKFCLISPHIPLEGTVSQIFDVKKRETFSKVFTLVFKHHF